MAVKGKKLKSDEEGMRPSWEKIGRLGLTCTYYYI